MVRGVNNNRLERDGCASPIHHKCHMPAARKAPGFFIFFFCVGKSPRSPRTFYKPNGPLFFFLFYISKTTSLSLSLSLSFFFFQFFYLTHFGKQQKNIKEKKMKNKKNCILKWHKDNRKKTKKQEREKRKKEFTEYNGVVVHIQQKRKITEKKKE
jgi:hypothetical protein